jgi:hypothetical protein
MITCPLYFSFSSSPLVFAKNPLLLTMLLVTYNTTLPVLPSAWFVPFLVLLYLAHPDGEEREKSVQDVIFSLCFDRGLMQMVELQMNYSPEIKK